MHVDRLPRRNAGDESTIGAVTHVGQTLPPEIGANRNRQWEGQIDGQEPLDRLAPPGRPVWVAARLDPAGHDWTVVTPGGHVAGLERREDRRLGLLDRRQQALAR